MTEPKSELGLFRRLYYGETSYRFVPHAKRWFILSGIVIVAGLASLGLNGLNLGIDFRGGTVWEVEAPDVTVEQARESLTSQGLADAKIQRLDRRGAEPKLRVQADIDESGDAQQRAADVTAVLADLAGVEPGDVTLQQVGPTWGSEITAKARTALVVFFLAIALYLTLRFEWKMAVAALAAVVHDIFITVGVYSIVGFQVSPATVIAFLTILGFSLYDTIVVFDKVHENTRGLASSGRLTYGQLVDLSMNQVLMRSLNTSLVAILPIISLLFVGVVLLGAVTLTDFGIALLIGLITGAYSSIFIAAPLLAILKEREPRYRAIKERLAGKGGVPGGSGLLTPAAAASARATVAGAGRLAGAGAAGAAPSPQKPSGKPGGGVAPRPRKKKRR